MHITLTDEEDVPEALTRLRVIYHNIMKLDYDNRRTRHSAEISGATEVSRKTPLQHFEDFFELQNGQPMNEEQREYVSAIIEEMWEGR